MNAQAPEPAPEERKLRSRLRALYYGHDEAALRFQGVLFVLDLLIVGFFVVTQFIREQSWFWVADIAVVAFLALDMGAKAFALGSLKRWLKYPATWADIIVFATLVTPALMQNWGFLRLLRIWSIVQRERFWNVLGGGRWDDTHIEDLSKSIVTLVVFVLMAAGATQALFLNHHPQLTNFIDALYFVVTSLTTTGYGDITLTSNWGRLYSMALMLTGISLFISIAQKAVSSPKKIVRCEPCGLDRHDVDARFCKFCGAKLGLALRSRARRARG